MNGKLARVLDIDAPFYASMESVYAGALKIIGTNAFHAQYAERCQEILTATRTMGWGLHDTLIELFYNEFEINMGTSASIFDDDSLD